MATSSSVAEPRRTTTSPRRSPCWRPPRGPRRLVPVRRIRPRRASRRAEYAHAAARRRLRDLSPQPGRGAMFSRLRLLQCFYANYVGRWDRFLEGQYNRGASSARSRTPRGSRTCLDADPGEAHHGLVTLMRLGAGLVALVVVLGGCGGTGTVAAPPAHPPLAAAHDQGFNTERLRAAERRFEMTPGSAASSFSATAGWCSSAITTVRAPISREMSSR